MYEITAIPYGYQYYPGPAVFYFRSWFEWVRLDFYFWLLKSEQHVVLVDTGMDQFYADKANPAVIQAVGDEKVKLVVEVDPIAALAQHGVSAEDVDYIILSHMHLDHIACVPRFPRAVFITSRHGLEWTLDPPYSQLVNPIFMPREILEFLRDEAGAGGRVMLTEDEAEPLPGIRTVRTGGHSECSQVILVQSGQGSVGFGVDNAMLYDHIEKGIAAGSPIDVIDAYRALDILAAEADLIVPGHDPRVMERHSGGHIA